MKILHVLFFLFFLFIFMNLTCEAQTLNEYKKGEEQKIRQLQQQNNAGEQLLKHDYQKFQLQADKDFAQYLSNRWKEFQAFQSASLPLHPKPKTVPVYQPPKSSQPVHSSTVVPLLVPKSPTSIPQAPSSPIISPIPKIPITGNSFQIDFWGRSLDLRIDKELLKGFPSSVSREFISHWWERESKTNYSSLIIQLLRIRKELELNDWAYFTLLQNMAEATVHSGNNDRRLLTWFLMIRSGYNMKIAVAGDSLFLIFPSDNLLYGRRYLVIKNRPFYLAEKTALDSFESYAFDFPGADRLMNFAVPSALTIGKRTIKKDFKFSFAKNDYSIPVVLNVDNLDFMENYPVTNLYIYFDAAMSTQTQHSLINDLKPIISKMNKKEALGFLLGFVQKAFAYETDRQQFGREKFFFPEEVFFYKASDCEDRAVLFSWLVRHLLGMKVIGLKYPEHVATAVLLGENVPGDYVIYENEKFIVADPTFIGAPIGMTMPEYKQVRPEIVPVD